MPGRQVIDKYMLGSCVGAVGNLGLPGKSRQQRPPPGQLEQTVAVDVDSEMELRDALDRLSQEQLLAAGAFSWSLPLSSALKETGRGAWGVKVGVPAALSKPRAEEEKPVPSINTDMHISRFGGEQKEREMIWGGGQQAGCRRRQ